MATTRNFNMLIKACFFTLFLLLMMNVASAATICQRYVPAHWNKGVWVEAQYVKYPCTTVPANAVYVPGRYYHGVYQPGYYRHAVPTAHRHATYRANHR